MKKNLLSLFKQRVILLFVSALFISFHVFPQATNYVWKNAPIGGGGFVTGIVTHKTSGDRYCRTDVGGAYRWDEANNKWIQLMDWLNESENGFIGVEALALDPQNANNIYMLCGTSYINNGRTAILRSTDKGNTFTYTDVTNKFKAHGNGSGRGNGERLAVDPNNSNILLCGTRANGLWKSTDAGVTWNLAWNGVTTTTNENGICFVLYDPSGSVVNGASQTIYMGVSRTGGGNIYKSTNGGATFTDITPTTGFMPHRAALQGTTMYVTYADGAGPALNGDGKLYKLNTATGVWTNVTPVHSKDYSYGGVSIDPTNVNRVIVSTCGMYWNNQFGTGWGDFIFLSTDGGSSWTLKNGTNATYDANGMGWSAGGAVNWMDCIEFDQANLSKVRVIGGGGIYTCTDITATNPSWKYDVTGIEETALLDVTSIPGGPVISSFGDVSGFVHEPLTAYPSKRLTPAGGYNNHSIAYAAANPNKVVRIANEGNIVYYSTDMGASWTGAATNKGASGRVAISADGGTILHCPWGSTTTWYTTNNGGSWSGCSGVSLGDAMPVADQVNSNYFYIYNPTNGQMLRSSNKGVSFSVAGTPGGTTAFHPWVPTLIRTVPGFEGHVWVPLGGNGLKYSTNAGAAYTTVSNVTYCKTVGIGKAMPGASYPTIFIWGTVSGVTGLFRSTDQGGTWLRLNDDATEFGGASYLVGDMNVAGRVYMGPNSGRGLIYWEPTACTATAITPYVQLNGGTWQQTANASLAAGGSVMFGPQPVTGGSWSWSGPNNFSAATREAGISNIQVNQAGNYVATYTDSGGCQSTQTFTVTVTSADTGSVQDPNFHIYLVFGQSNMEGAGTIESQDKVGVDVRFRVMGALDCTGDHTHQLGKWTTATPPLVRCWTGLGISDYFGRTMVQELPSGIKIGIVPVAVGGCDIALFDKVNYASYVASAPSWMKDVINSYGGNPYGRLVEVAKLAKKEGVIKGILFHQGETNTNNTDWKNKVADVVRNLKTDLQLGDVPFLAGELLASTGACCGSHNVEVNKIPSVIPNAHVISSAGLTGADPAHFTSASYREFGKRYAKKMIELLGITTCTPTAITPYVQLNGGAWQQTDNASVAQGDSVKFSPQPATGGSWSWLGPNNFSAATREVTISNIQSTQVGNYVATYTNSGGCQSTQTFSVTVTSAATGGLYPNPANKGRFTILLKEYSENAVVKIYDNLGRMLYKKNAPGGNRIEIDSRLKPGIYHVRVNSKAFNFTKKLIVK